MMQSNTDLRVCNGDRLDTLNTLCYCKHIGSCVWFSAPKNPGSRWSAKRPFIITESVINLALTKRRPHGGNSPISLAPASIYIYEKHTLTIVVLCIVEAYSCRLWGNLVDSEMSINRLTPEMHFQLQKFSLGCLNTVCHGISRVYGPLYTCAYFQVQILGIPPHSRPPPSNA